MKKRSIDSRLRTLLRDVKGMRRKQNTRHAVTARWSKMLDDLEARQRRVTRNARKKAST